MSLLAGYLVPHPPIIIPEIGMGEERKIAATSQSYVEISKEIAKLAPDTIVIISPHGPVFSDAITIRTASPLVGDLGAFGAPQIELKHSNDVEKYIMAYGTAEWADKMGIAKQKAEAEKPLA